MCRLQKASDEVLSISRTLTLAAVLAALLASLSPLGARAADTGAITGTVHSADGAPIAHATVILRGPSPAVTTTDASGAFSFPTITPGDYAVVASKAGYQRYENDNVLTFIGETTTVNVVLAPSSFSTLKTIANVSTNAAGHAQINTSTASISTISNQVFADQGLTQVTDALNETPGIISYPVSAASGGSGNNGASKGAEQTIQIRGALPYETEQLIDGHPTSLDLAGSFNPIYLSPALLQDVELVKGPGSMPSEINYAIGGTVNYRTLEPTSTPREEVQIGEDNWGGINTAFRATGSVPSHRIDYAFGFATDGAPGPLSDYPIPGSGLGLIAGSPNCTVPPLGTCNGWRINGQPIAVSPVGAALPPPSRSKYYGTVGAEEFQEPLYVCCATVSTAYNSKAELGKIRLNFSQTSSLTLSYLGGQAGFDGNGSGLTSLDPVGDTGPFSTFVPPAGYSGSVASGTPIPFDLNAYVPDYTTAQQNLYQAEFRTTFGPYTLLARYFTGADNAYTYLDTQSTATKPYVFKGRTWGGIPVCPSGYSTDLAGDCFAPGSVTPTPSTMTFFNGQLSTFEAPEAINSSLELDHLRGESVLLDREAANGNYLTLSLDRSNHFSQSWSDVPTGDFVGYSVPPSSSQQFTTESLHGHFMMTGKLFADLSDYMVQYESHYTGDGGATWHDATHGYNAPRAGLTWRPNTDLAVRLAAGASIAPPFISLLTSSGSAPTPNVNGAPTAFVENANNGAIGPETAFGYDLGADKRIGVSTAVSADVYYTNLYGEFLDSVHQNGFYNGSGLNACVIAQCPLLIVKAANLGFARYQGVELAVQRAPLVGFGFKVQGNLQRAYPYNVPNSFYCVALGPGVPCDKKTYNTNLGIINGVNFQPEGLGWNALTGAPVPYSMGYAEINYRSQSRFYVRLGTTYWGPNNPYAVPAFFITSGSVRFPVHETASVQFSIDNIFNTHGQDWPEYFGGTPVPLVNGFLGPTTAGNYGPTRFGFTFTDQLGE
jgi:outer membrane receptor protein involved in Fe transport